jgi:uncharacterized protein (DUF433 family)
MQIEIPDEIGAKIAQVAEETGQDVASLAAEMLTEAIKMRRVPGIVFADGATGRRARIGGTGIEVFEVIGLYEYIGRDRDELQRHFDWLDTFQLDMAVAYYEAFPEDIAPYLLTEEEETAALEDLWRRVPQTSPHWPGRQKGHQSPAAAQSRESA